MDLRGFGFSAKPDWPVHSAYSPEAQAKNVLTLLDQLNVESIVLGGYAIGSRVAQMITHMAPERVHSLVLSAPVYPGFGTRPLEPEAQQERWYQHFHMLPQADQLIGHDQETVRLTGLSPLRAYSLKRGSILPSFQGILEAEEESSTQKEESNHDYHADETRTDSSTCHRR